MTHKSVEVQKVKRDILVPYSGHQKDKERTFVLK